MFSLPWNKI